MKLLGKLLFAAGVLGVSGCGSDPVGSEPALLMVLRGSQQDTVRSTLDEDYAVGVFDAAGQPVEGVIIEWTTNSGTLSATSDTSDALGVVTTSHTLGTAAGQAVTVAQVAGVALEAEIVSIVTAGMPVSIEKVEGDTGSEPIGTVVRRTIRVVDSWSNPVVGVTVQWAWAGGSLAGPNPSTTDAIGQASVLHTLSGAVGDYAAEATINAGGATLSTTFTTSATTAVVAVANSNFTPNIVTIAAGESVIWRWPASLTLPHNVTFSAASGIADVANRTSGSETRTFVAAGTYAYQCTNHGGMSGVITVQ